MQTVPEITDVAVVSIVIDSKVIYFQEGLNKNCKF